MVYWLNGNLDGKTVDQAQVGELESQIASYEEEIAGLKRENSRLAALPPKEVLVEKECPAAGSDIMTQSAECAPCPECPKAETVVTAETEPDAKSKQVTFHKPTAVATMVCTKMAIGKWDMPRSCLKELQQFLKTSLDDTSDFFVITPIVDTRRYKGKQPELKQAGLGQYRAESVKKELTQKVGPNLHIFQKKTMQKHEMRGFVVELYRIGQAE